MRKNIESKVEELVKPLIEGAGYELVALEYVKEGSDWYLRCFIDHPRGITIDDCELVSRQVEEILDREDPIPGSYILEVSSPGVERPLRTEEDFKKYQGNLVLISTYAAIEGQKSFKGVLKGSSADEIIVTVGKKDLSIPRKLISKALLTVDF